jgi:DNA-directed RNA polymerase specialized sigma24 family protein
LRTFFEKKQLLQGDTYAFVGTISIKTLMLMDISRLKYQFQTNETAIFKQLYRQCFPKVAYMVKALGGNQLEAEDIFQESLVILYEKVMQEDLQLRTNPQAYLLGIAKHLWVRTQKANAHLITFSQLERQMVLPASFHEAPAPSKLNVFRLLSVAGKKCMDLLQAFYYQHLSANQLASDFGFSSARSATAQKYKCLEKIREQVKQKQLRYEEVVD